MGLGPERRGGARKIEEKALPREGVSEGGHGMEPGPEDLNRPTPSAAETAPGRARTGRASLSHCLRKSGA